MSQHLAHWLAGDGLSGRPAAARATCAKPTRASAASTCPNVAHASSRYPTNARPGAPAPPMVSATTAIMRSRHRRPRESTSTVSVRWRTRYAAISAGLPSRSSRMRRGPCVSSRPVSARSDAIARSARVYTPRSCMWSMRTSTTRRGAAAAPSPASNRSPASPGG
eukprot:359034-Chlamydomonas_euryale.AAC.2